VFNVKGVNILVRNVIGMCGAVRHIVCVFIYSGPINIAAVIITLGL
jgi:hypothetical protein